MGVQGWAFVTPHAVARFRERIDPSASAEQARQAIIDGLARPYAHRTARARDGRPQARLVVRTAAHLFVAVVVGAWGPASLPQVVTVVPATRATSRATTAHDQRTRYVWQRSGWRRLPGAEAA